MVIIIIITHLCIGIRVKGQTTQYETKTKKWEVMQNKKEAYKTNIITQTYWARWLRFKTKKKLQVANAMAYAISKKANYTKYLSFIVNIGSCIIEFLKHRAWTHE